MKSIFFRINIFILYFFLSLIKVISSIEFNYPSAISLNNGNIFIIEKMGISIYDEQLKNLIHEYPFTEESEKINTLDKLSNIIIKKSNNYIICLINLRIYFFNEVGELLLKENYRITTDECYHLALTPIPLNDNNNFYYIVGYYTYSSQNEVYILHLLYYKIDLIENKNYYINSLEFDIFISSFWGNEYDFLNQGLDCEYMSMEDDNDIMQLTCFVIIKRSSKPTLSQIFFDVDETKISKSDDYYYDYVESLKEVKKLQSITNNNRDNSLICILFTDKSLNCYLFSYGSKGNFYETINLNFNCRSELYGMKLNYLEEYQKISLSCIDDNATVQSNFFNDQFYSVSSYKQFSECQSIYGLSVIYSNSKLNVISDVICDNITRIYEPLDGALSPFIEIIEIIDPTVDLELSEEEEDKKEDEIEEEEGEDQCVLEKCKKCNQESINQNLCISCNEEKNYYYINYNPSKEKEKYIDCIKEEEKPQRYYFNNRKKSYEPCFETCSTCEQGGNHLVHNCKTCDGVNYIKNPEDETSSNCLKKCEYFYYMTYGQYSCTDKPYCPDEYNFMIKDKSKCTNDCLNDKNHNFRYNGECYSQCPENTEDVDNNFFCKDKNNQCALTKKDMNYLEESISDAVIDKLVKKYEQEFSYTNNHVSIYENLECSIMIYVNSVCIKGYLLGLLNIDLGSCYEKMLEETSNEKLIIVVINKKPQIDGKNSIEFRIYSPSKGKYLNTEEICQEDRIILEQIFQGKELIFHNAFLDFGLELFDLSSPIYTDICYQYNSTKDIALKDRVSIYYPNIKLCEDGCELKGINLTTNSTICECFLSESKREENLKNKILEQAQLGAIEQVMSNSNIYVLKCIKLIFNINIFKRCYGAFIILGFICIEIISIIFYFLKNIISVNNYIFAITNKYINNINKQPQKSRDNNGIFKKPELIIYDDTFKNNPPPKQKLISKKSSNSINPDNKKVIRKKSQAKNKTTINKNINIIINHNENLEKSRAKSIYKYQNYEDISILSGKQLNSLKPNEPDGYNNLFSSVNDNIDININEYLENQLDDMDYDEAIRKENRKFCQCFLEKLKNEQIIINTFYSYEPIKPRAIKIVIFILDINLYFFVNGLFYDDDYISKVYHLQKDTFSTKAERFLDNLIFTALAGIIFNFIIEFIFIEEIKIKRILKYEKDNILNLKYEITKIIKSIKKRYIIFVILTLIISFFTFIHIACFNIVYRHIMMEWIIFSLIIISIIQVATFLFCLFQAGLRVISIKCKSEKLFELSQVKL